MAVFTRRQFSVKKGICHMSQPTITQLHDPSGAPWSPAGSGAADLGGVVEADEKFFRGHFLLRTICGMDKLSDMIDLQYMRAGLDREEVSRQRGGEEWILT